MSYFILGWQKYEWLLHSTQSHILASVKSHEFGGIKSNSQFCAGFAEGEQEILSRFAFCRSSVLSETRSSHSPGVLWHMPRVYKRGWVLFCRSSMIHFTAACNSSAEKLTFPHKFPELYRSGSKDIGECISGNPFKYLFQFFIC